jgi:O-antigen ligase
MSLRTETKPKEMWLYLAGVGAAGLNVLLSVSRAALGAFAVGCALVLLLAFLRGPSKRVLGLSALGALAAVVVVTTAMHSFFARVKEEKDRGAEEDLRIVMIAQAKLMLHDSAIGIGWNNYGIADSEPIPRYSQIMEDWDQSRGFTIYEENYTANPLTESYYWLILGETGYPGIFGCALFFGATLLYSFRCLCAYWRTAFGWFSGGIFVSLLLLYGHSTLERVLSQTKNLGEWLMLAGCVAGLEMRRRQRPSAGAPAAARLARAG